MQYRPDIDGLRAIAVVPVVLYHARFESFSGGFVGVDVFFVISGYLITSLIAPEMQRGEFSLVRFYERRVRRLFPALFSTLLFCTVVAALLFMPGHFRDFSQSLVAATLFASNVLFWQEAGYFDAPAEFKPLLHTWSLAVEEQFYIVFPVLLLLLLRLSPRLWKSLLVGLGVASFCFSLWAVPATPQAAFYLPFTRMWELLLGAGLALGLAPSPHHGATRSLEAGAGVALIATAVFTYSHDTPFPGAAALLPCLGTAAIIHARAPAGDRLTGFLHRGPVVYVGLLSYSLYLWHWPLIVFLKYYRLGALSLPDRLLVVATSFVLAALSLRYIEAPVRRRRLLAGRRALFAVAALGMVATVSAGLAGHVTHGWPQRLPPEALRLAAYAESTNPDRARCHGSERNPITPETACVFGPGTRPPEIAVWGDSHASMFVPALAEHYGKQGRRLVHLSFSGCPPAPEFTRTDLGEGDPCARFNEQALRFLEATPTIHKVLLIARWTSHLHPAVNSVLRDPRQRRDEYARSLTAGMESLLAAGKQILLFYPVPEIFRDTPSILARILMLGRSPDSLKVPLEQYRHRNEWILSVLDGLATRPGVTSIRPQQVLCATGNCVVYAGRDVLYHDDNHLSQPGARGVIEALAAQL